MSYFNPKIYCKQNLKKEDRRELDYWEQAFHDVVGNASADVQEDGCYGIPVFADIENQVVEAFCERLKENIGYVLQDTAVGLIDGYGDDVEVKEWEEPETYLYAGEENKTEESENE